MGKGSNRRPATVSPDQYASNYERTFGKARQNMEQIVAELDRRGEIPQPGDIIVHAGDDGLVVYNSKWAIVPRGTTDISPKK